MSEMISAEAKGVRGVLWLTIGLLLSQVLLLVVIFRHVETHLAESDETLRGFGRSMGAQLEVFASFAKYTTDGSTLEEDGRGSPSVGNPQAPVRVIEFADFLCPACKLIADSIARYVGAHPQNVHFVFKHYPLVSLREHAYVASLAGACADIKGRFWQYAEAAYRNQVAITSDGADRVLAIGKEIGVDSTDFARCVASAEARAIVERDRAIGAGVAILDTPTFFVNGRRISGGNWKFLKAAIEWEVLRHDRQTKAIANRK